MNPSGSDAPFIVAFALEIKHSLKPVLNFTYSGAATRILQHEYVFVKILHSSSSEETGLPSNNYLHDVYAKCKI